MGFFTVFVQVEQIQVQPVVQHLPEHFLDVAHLDAIFDLHLCLYVVFYLG